MSLMLKELRKERHLTQQAVADGAGISRSVLSQYESEAVDPTATVISRLADFFQVSADYLLGRSDDLGAPVAPRTEISREEQQLLKDFRALSRHSRELILGMVHSAAEKEQRA